MSAIQPAMFRPLSLSELLDRSLRVYRRHFFTFVGLVAAVQIPITIASLVLSQFTFGAWFQRLNTPGGFSGRGQNPFDILGVEYWLGILGNLLISVVSLFLMEGLVSAATARTVSASLFGERLGMLEAMRRALLAMPRLAVTLLMALLLGIAQFVWLLIPCVGWFTGVGAFVYFSLILTPLVVPVVVLEQRGPGAALRRAWDLARRRFWWVLGFVIVVVIFGVIVVNGPIYLLTFVLGAVQPGSFNAAAFDVFNWQNLISTASAVVLTILYQPLRMITTTFLYLDLRARFEGLDLALAAAEPGGASAEAVVAQAPAPGTGALLTGREIGYFAALSVGGLAVFVAVYAIFFGLGLLLLSSFSP